MKLPGRFTVQLFMVMPGSPTRDRKRAKSEIANLWMNVPIDHIQLGIKSC